jgi:hypothetical protein
VPQRAVARVAHPAYHEGGQGRQVGDGAHQETPKAAAACTPERQPSSWKPQPW